MESITALEAKNRFGRLLDSAQRHPVSITKNGRPSAVVISVADFERMRGDAWERLVATAEETSAEAASKGLTDADLERLLADES